MTITATAITSRVITARAISAINSSATPVEPICLSTFNGTSSYAEATNRVINLDAVDPSFTIQWYGDLPGDGTIFSQNVSASGASQEFRVFIFSDDFRVYLGGTSHILTTNVNPFAGYGVQKLVYNFAAATLQLFKDDALIASVGSVSIGAAREPTARFKLMARSDGTPTSQAFFKAGDLKAVNILHNGIEYDLPMTECAVDGSVTYNETNGNTTYGYNVTTNEVFAPLFVDGVLQSDGILTNETILGA